MSIYPLFAVTAPTPNLNIALGFVPAPALPPALVSQDSAVDVALHIPYRHVHLARISANCVGLLYYYMRPLGFPSVPVVPPLGY